MNPMLRYGALLLALCLVGCDSTYKMEADHKDFALEWNASVLVGRPTDQTSQ